MEGWAGLRICSLSAALQPLAGAKDMDTHPKGMNLPPALPSTTKCSCQMVSVHQVPPRMAPQGSTMATEGVSVTAGDALDFPNLHNVGHSHCYNLGKDIGSFQ